MRLRRCRDNLRNVNAGGAQPSKSDKNLGPRCIAETSAGPSKPFSMMLSATRSMCLPPICDLRALLIDCPDQKLS